MLDDLPRHGQGVRVILVFFLNVLHESCLFLVVQFVDLDELVLVVLTLALKLLLVFTLDVLRASVNQLLLLIGVNAIEHLCDLVAIDILLFSVVLVLTSVLLVGTFFHLLLLHLLLEHSDPIFVQAELLGSFQDLWVDIIEV